MNIETIAIHAGNIVTDSHQPAVMPITLSTTFLHQEESLIYSRANNPNRMALEQVLRQLEYGKDAAAFSSGNAAGMAVFQSLEPGSHVIAPDDMYHGLRNQLIHLFRGVLSVSFVDMANLDAVAAAFRQETALVWIETPSNPLLKIASIQSIAQLAKGHACRVVCDNTFATPVFQNPLTLGADIVMHSTTKYLGGHSDILGGALVTKEQDEFWTKVRMVQHTGGAVPSPFDCYYLCRSIKTLPYRMKGHAANGRAIAAFLDQHPQVEQVYFPGLASHVGNDIAAAQMKDFGGMLSFLISGDASTADNFISKLRYFTNATSLGGVESLIERRAASEGPDTQTPENLIRVSVGLESLEDLIKDLSQAF
ncbi:trans-sulfuration enzyme family protein [Mongoliitalea daihaiensis]|uniref:trans-sulfuration enzyme family protein n=1 Tax=Mongoliitalea daihaiensis TaxID=2782006 RepID=UPI001F3BB616|nr:aminotransferase class I/II-fold pyridoxal phosphate-dependent enzyme [Mongoliitalea daihaiensis]UJP65269.1 aminotransferase class I/II-fold pyridoxal phosphate-dependent enzyme [Mongoliitalea daihaiensis]